jgi:hypothetical protein
LPKKSLQTNILDYLKQLKQKFGEFYTDGLTRNQKILAGVALVLLATGILLWIFSPGTSAPVSSTSQSLVTGQEDSTAPNGQSAKNISSNPSSDSWIGAENPTPVAKPANGGQNPDNPVRQIDLPSLRYDPNPEANTPPGPMDGFIAQLKEDYKNSPDYDLIVGYLSPLKDIGDGRRAWNDLFRQSAVEFFGGKKAREIEAEINRLNGNKEARIRNSHYNSLDEVSAAVQKDTENYIEKGAINGFLDHAKEAADSKYPWNSIVAELGEIDLEKAWVDQVDNQVRQKKEAKARNFQAVRYANLSQLITAIKEDTKTYEQIFARDMFLDYLYDQYKNHKLTEAVILSGSNLLEEYHLEALKKFINN